MQASQLRRSADLPEEVFARYEDLKRSHLDTEALCRAAGLRFTPLVLEAHAGGWSKSMRGLVDWIAESVAAARSTVKEVESLRIAQRISATLQRGNARAVLRRLGAAEEAPSPSAWADVCPLDASGEAPW